LLTNCAAERMRLDTRGGEERTEDRREVPGRRYRTLSVGEIPECDGFRTIKKQVPKGNGRRSTEVW